jgi:uncharacterized membrane protein YraQ (UPF0718 family)
VNAVDQFLVIFSSIVFEAMPFIILGALISGVLEELLPQQWITGMLPRRHWQAIAGSALLGLVFPMCECGIVPVMRRLLNKGLPLSCAVAYMLAAPIINPVVIASTWAAFSGGTREDGLTSYQMVALRVGLAFLTAFAVGLIVERLARRKPLSELVRVVPGTHRAGTAKGHLPAHEHGAGHAHPSHADHGPACHHEHEPAHEHGPDCCHHEHEHEHRHPGSSHSQEPSGIKELPLVSSDLGSPAPEPRVGWGRRLSNISETALRDFVDIACFLVIGAFLASWVQAFLVLEKLPESIMDPIVGPLIAVPTMILLAIVLCLCSEADAFVAANLIKVPLGGKLAFLVLGPMLDLKLYMMYTRVFRSRLIWTIIPSVLALVFILSLAAQYLDWYARP